MEKLKLASALEEKLNALITWLKNETCVVAFSGGVDSATLAKALSYAYEQYPELKRLKPIGYFAESYTTTAIERTEARRIAQEIGIELRVLQSKEFEDQRFVENSPLRCYWCKKVRFEAIKTVANEEFRSKINQEILVIDGSNADDKNDFRPGSRAAREVGVRSPFAELNISKAEIRSLASYWGLSVAQKPSNPCLATRIGYYLKLDNAILRQVEAAELAIKKILNVETCRARVDALNSVRIEIPEACISGVLSQETRRNLVVELRKVGFNFVSLDLEGFVSGKNNRSVT